ATLNGVPCTPGQRQELYRAVLQLAAQESDPGQRTLTHYNMVLQDAELREAMLALRKCREAAGVSLASLSERTGIDRAALSRLETGAQDNPTINTLQRYAFALGKQIVVQVIDLPAAQVPGDG
ncbi:MAG TPA: helix-turn-helix domain-containing protein, partial [Pirellulales bacterium]|nr:helix-turn-helix domain-containing protein [Pirellulales bacterium]